jgi:hypothetical protein
MWRIGWAPKSIPIYIQRAATLHSLFISRNCSTCFGWYHPKHVEQFPDINKLCNVAARWIYEYIRLLLRARPILHKSRLRVKVVITCAYHSVGKTQEYINKYSLLQFEVFTMKTQGVQNVSTFSCWPSSSFVNQYSYKVVIKLISVVLKYFAVLMLVQYCSHSEITLLQQWIAYS